MLGVDYSTQFIDRLQLDIKTTSDNYGRTAGKQRAYDCAPYYPIKQDIYVINYTLK